MRILLVAPDHPFETSYGLGQRINLLYRALLRTGRVDVLVVQEAHVPSHPPEMENLLGVLKWDTRAFGPWNRYRPAPELVAWKIEHLDPDDYDLVVSQHLTPLCRIGGFAPVPSILDFDDADHLKKHEDPGTSVMRRIVRGMKDRARTHYVKRAALGFDHVWFTSERDRLVTRFADGDVLPNIPFVAEGESLDGDPDALPERRAVLWVGPLDFRPNLEGIRRFLELGWPVVRARFPDATLRLVGRASDEVKREVEAHAGAHVLGFVPDLGAEYAGARFAIAPIRLGGGTNIKVVEAFARGRTCVVTPFSHYGYERALVEGEALLVARDEREMGEHCVRLLGDVELCVRLARTGQESVRRQHSFERFAEVVERGVQRFARGRAP